ncbi:hypothetical protein J113_18490 [Mycobacterium tuberculosis CAS/NITR204]|uniref:Uncharacterized protein n=1 Tax=Mycobacterium tuberculosis CAS/NITR204 TaxID=1310114 RepID=R4MJG2_MYCTX|nr:hypothetical protein J113_18490 [Mycobacterium tuberculosis CAS/NITR204]
MGDQQLHLVAALSDGAPKSARSEHFPELAVEVADGGHLAIRHDDAVHGAALTRPQLGRAEKDATQNSATA